MIISHLNEIEETLKKSLQEVLPQDIFVLFDIDLTLIQPLNPATYMSNVIQYREVMKKETQHLTREQKDLLINLATASAPWGLVEETSPYFIKTLQDKGVNVLAFTASLTGKLEEIGHLEIWREQRLANLGFNFQKTFPENHTLKEVPSHMNRYPVLYKGILCANGEGSKGVVLTSFLRHFDLKPKVVMLIDDRRKNLDDVRTSLKAYSSEIHFFGFEYVGAQSFYPDDISEVEFIAFWREKAEKAKAISPIL
ncbi:MAG: DUF2608 domain-containing protein [Alphaproteobacteria bacterium]|nr:DUF2608 domain-containing protein [Alphaproteobacteria bacterium]